MIFFPQSDFIRYYDKRRLLPQNRNVAQIPL